MLIRDYLVTIFFLIFAFGLMKYVDYFFPEFKVTKDMSSDVIKEKRKKWALIFLIGLPAAALLSQIVSKILLYVFNN